MTKKYNIAIVGATGVVGKVFLEILEQRKFPIASLYLLASHNSIGKKISFNGKDIAVEDLANFDFTKADIGLFSAGALVSKKYAPKAVDANCIVIDNTSYFRRHNDIPLVVPEVNPSAIANYKNHNIIANPNCSTIQMLVALKPIYDEVGISRINVATYQAVSGSGQKAIDELTNQIINLMNVKDIDISVYPKQIAFNVIPHIDVFQDNDYTKEEMKIVWETRKILDDDTILINPTAVRVPVIYGHSEAIHIETKNKITKKQAINILSSAKGVSVINANEDGGYATPFTDASNKDDVFVSRIREDISHPLGLNLWVVSDNLRKGAALNSIQIAETLIHKYL